MSEVTVTHYNAFSIRRDGEKTALLFKIPGMEFPSFEVQFQEEELTHLKYKGATVRQGAMIREAEITTPCQVSITEKEDFAVIIVDFDVPGQYSLNMEITSDAINAPGILRMIAWGFGIQI